MSNTLAWELTQPRTDTLYAMKGEIEAKVAIPATAAATAKPDANTDYISTGPIDTIRVFVAYSGIVTSASLTLWLLQDGLWYRGATDTLDPTGGNETLDMMMLGAHTRFAFQVSAIAGGGTAEVRVMGVW